MKYIFSFTFLTLWLVSFTQSHADRHSSVTADAWLSCATSANPNSSRGTSHWIRYDLGRNYSIANIDIWNFNHPDSLGMGIRDAHIDISTDGVTWTSMGQFTVPRATGSTLYPGAKSVHSLGFQPARYILITPVNNHGGGSCFGMAEIQFHLSGSLLPVTFTDLKTECSGTNTTVTWESKSEKNIIKYNILASDDAKNWSIIQTVEAKGRGKYTVSINQSSIPYYIKISAEEYDQKTTESEITINECQYASDLVKIQPNPFINQFDLLFSSAEVKPQSIRLMDLSGRVVFTRKISESASIFTIMTPDIQKGVYLAEVKMYGDRKYIMKVVKM